MKNKSRIKVIILTLGIVFVFLSINNYNIFHNDGAREIRDEVDLKNLKRSGFWNLGSPISIIGNSGWATIAATEEWCSGNGTWVNPYLIENVTIEGQSSESCIRIENSDVPFIIRNCTLIKGRTGIDLRITNNGTLINNNCSNNNLFGIQINGIISPCINNSISNNVIANNGVDGLVLERCLNNTILGNSIKNDTIYLDNSHYNYFSGNLLKNHIVGITLLLSDYNIISGNKFYNISIPFQDLGSTGNIIAMNNHDGIYSPVIIDNSGNGDFTWFEASKFDWCNGSGTWNAPYTIENVKIDGKGIDSCLTVRDSLDYFIIRNCTVYNSGLNNVDAGIKLDHVDNGIIHNNTCLLNNNHGISLSNSNYNILSKNTLINNSYGISFGMGNNNNTLFKNLIQGNINTGLKIEATSIWNIIYYNTFNNNKINAEDNGLNNQWDNGSIGNWWDDYKGYDFNGDNIGDDPYYIPGITGSIDYYPIGGNLLPIFYITLQKQSFSIQDFNFTFFIYNSRNDGIENVTIQMSWNGTDVSSSIQNLENGFYFVSLTPITVSPGEDPIVLSMNISADGYEDKYLETYIAVDPDILKKETGEPTEEFPLTIISIAISSIAGGIGVVGITIFLLRKKKRASEVKKVKF